MIHFHVLSFLNKKSYASLLENAAVSPTAGSSMVLPVMELYLTHKIVIVQFMGLKAVHQNQSFCQSNLFSQFRK
jgi:hypothetical protein